MFLIGPEKHLMTPICFYCLFPEQVCDAVQVSPALSEQLLQVFEQFSAAGPLGAPELLYDGLSCVLRPWPQLLRDFAAFLNREQAGRCGLVSDLTLTSLRHAEPWMYYKNSIPDQNLGPCNHDSRSAIPELKISAEFSGP